MQGKQFVKQGLKKKKNLGTNKLLQVIRIMVESLIVNQLEFRMISHSVLPSLLLSDPGNQKKYN